MSDMTTAEVKRVIKRMFNDYKALEKGLEVIAKLELVEQTEREILGRIASHESKENALLARNDEIDQMFADAEEKAKQIVNSAENEAQKAVSVIEDEQLKHRELLAEAREKLVDVQRKIVAAQAGLAEYQKKLTSLKSELAEHEEAKVKLLKALGG
ncbi:hypothetical protein KAR91_59850 [Candidatus Pacearchaeota archaeon]|nr:hypothetical protein [Candidatus Pacearchaeota archaeon]